MEIWQIILQVVSIALTAVIAIFQPIILKKIESKQKANEQRPNLRVKKYIEPHKYEESEKCDINVLITRANYNPDAYNVNYDFNDTNKENWVSVIYELENVGSTQIDVIYIGTNSKQPIAVFNALPFKETLENVHKPTPLKTTSEFYRIVKHQDCFTLRICFPTEQDKFKGIKQFESVIWLLDKNDNWWAQLLKAPHNELAESAKFTKEEFEKYYDLKYFDNTQNGEAIVFKTVNGTNI